MSMRHAVLLAIAVGFATTVPANAQTSACAGARFVTATAVLSGGPVPDALVLTSVEPQQLVRWTCSGAQTKVRVGKRGARVRGTWTACGSHQRVRFAAAIDPTCTTMTGKVKARGEARVNFTAIQEACPELTESSPTAVFLDCAYGKTWFSATPTGTPALHVVSIYESAQGTFNTHVRGQMSIQVDDPGPSVLFLHSYEGTNFVVQAATGAVLSDVMAEGYYTPALSLPLGVPGEILSWELGNWIDGDCSNWSATNDMCVNDVEPQRVLDHTGLCVASHDGCYRANQVLLP